jgi:hypothetical protein
MSTNAIKIEAQLYLPCRGIDDELFRDMIERLYGQLEEPVLSKLPRKDQFLRNVVNGWRDWKAAPSDYGLPTWGNDQAYLGTDEKWSLTDLMLYLTLSGGLRIGIEFSWVDDSLVSEKSDLLLHSKHALGKIATIAECLTSTLLAKSTFILAVELNRQDYVAREWAVRTLDEFWKDSLVPAMQEMTGNERRTFCDIVAPPGRSQGLALDWSLKAQNEQVFTRAHGGAKRLRLSSGSVLKANFLFWARQGGAIDQVFPSGWPVFPSSRGIVFSSVADTYIAAIRSSNIHEELKFAQRELLEGKGHSLELFERNIKLVRELAANLQLYKLNTARALLDLGVLNSRLDANGLLEYLQETRDQLLYEAERFSPETERAVLEMERSGGLLGWPGFILAGAALTLASLDTWWGVMDTIASPNWKDENRLLAFYTACVIAASLFCSAIVFLGLAIREFRRRELKASRVGVKMSFVRNAIGPAVIFLVACAFALGAIAYLCVVHAFDGTRATLQVEMTEGPSRK